MKTVTVIREHRSTFPDPLRLSKGARISLGREDTEYPGWVWSSADNGTSGWIPKSILDIRDGRGTLRADYDATELTVVPGEMLELLSEESGWVWCRDTAGKAGWVPTECVSEP